MQGGVSFKSVVCRLGNGGGIMLSVGLQGLVGVDGVLSFILVMVR